jgi:hypothetical protein
MSGNGASESVYVAVDELRGLVSSSLSALGYDSSEVATLSEVRLSRARLDVWVCVGMRAYARAHTHTAARRPPLLPLSFILPTNTLLRTRATNQI